MSPHIIHRATFRSYVENVLVTLSLLREGGCFLVRFDRGTRVLDQPCRSADEAETVYCRLLHFGMTGEDLPPTNPNAYLER